MKVYRVCSKAEAQSQQRGQVYHVSVSGKTVQSAHPGLHATLIPEHWRRILNKQMASQGLGMRYTHTLLLEVPDDVEETVSEPLRGMEYRIDDPSKIIVIAIAGAEWPLPAWVPQPTREIDWEPTSTAWSIKVCRWQPIL